MPSTIIPVTTKLSIKVTPLPASASVVGVIPDALSQGKRPSFRALDVLKDDGLICGVPGLGVFVR
jgi:hypothetical protein